MAGAAGENNVPLLAPVRTWMTDKLATLSKESDLAHAIQDSLNRREALGLYCEDGQVEISNALAENALRAPGA